MERQETTCKTSEDFSAIKDDNQFEVTWHDIIATYNRKKKC